MKNLSLFLMLLIFGSSLLAQEVSELPKDETGKYIYYEVVHGVVLPEDSLIQKLTDFIAENKKEIKEVSRAEKSIKAKGKMVISKTLAMLSRPSGEIIYNFYFEVNEQKYRFWLTDFKFIPYYRDRYGNFVPSTSVGEPLENKPKKSNAAQWEDYKVQVSNYTVNFANRLKNYLSSKPEQKLTPSEKKVVSKTW